MISRVLVPMDDSELSDEALRYALEAHTDAEITVLHIVGEPSGMMGKALSFALEEDVEEAAEEAAEKLFSRARDVAAEYDAEIDTEVTWGSPAKEILKRADHYDTIVLGSHSGGVADLLFVGNVARSVFRESPTPVTVVR